MQPLRFGILSTGNIATQFAEGVNGGATRSALAAVASRSQDKAQAFAVQHNIPGGRAYGSYDELLADPTVDAVYNALPNLYHKEWSLKALAAGKHVLCEKPMGMDAGETEAMFEAAKRAGRVLTEAFMYRTHPQTQAVLKAIRDGAIGRVKTIRVSFCYRTTNMRQNVRFDRSLGGGAIMDIGCYCLDFANQVAGAMPESVYAAGRLIDATDGGQIDVSASGVLRYPGGIDATFTCAMDTQASNLAQVCGEAGYIEVPVPWKPGIKGPVPWTIQTMRPPRQDNAPDRAGEDVQSILTETDKPLYALEADAFAASVLDGTPPFMSAAESIGNAKVLDEMRRQVGVVW